MFDRVFATVILLVGLYLVLSNADAANNILNSLGNAYRQQFETLQGR